MRVNFTSLHRGAAEAPRAGVAVWPPRSPQRARGMPAAAGAARKARARTVEGAADGARAAREQGRAEEAADATQAKDRPAAAAASSSLTWLFGGASAPSALRATLRFQDVVVAVGGGPELEAGTETCAALVARTSWPYRRAV